ncbi:unnamed protein product [Amoebophrya sp. A25]|nr:unnamed protein product [Amoebophrya sp. A25]|eukprot:GSA25T00000534001.1
MTILNRASSVPALRFPVGSGGKQIPSGFQGAPSYSFGAEVYCKTRASPRSSYLGVIETPGPGTYNMDKIPPEVRTMPRYSMGKQLRDKDMAIAPALVNRTYVSHKNVTVPGPGQYEADVMTLRKAAPLYSHGHRRPIAKGYWSRPNPGPDVYRKENTHRLLQREFPRWTFGREDGRKKSSEVKTSTTRVVGPGTYRHATCLVPT